MTTRLSIALFASCVLMLVLAIWAEQKSKSLVSKAVQLSVSNAIQLNAGAEPVPNHESVRDDLISEATVFSSIGIGAAVAGTALVFVSYRLPRPTFRFSGAIRNVPLVLLIVYTLLAIIIV